MPKILLFIDWYLPGFKAGGPVSSCANMIAALRNEFEFFVVTRNTEYCETTPYPEIPANEWVTRDKNEHVMYLSNDALNQRRVTQLIKEFDGNIIYINGIYSKYFSVFPLKAAKKIKKDFKIIVASRGMLSRSAIEVKQIKKKVFLALGKTFGWYSGVIFHATNVKEEKDIKSVFGPKTMVQIANNISGLSQLPANSISKTTNHLRLVSIARIAPEKNLLFLLRALQKVKGIVLLDLFGQIYNEKYWEECKVVLAALPKNVKVNYCGMVNPDNVGSTIQKYHFLVLPSLGENFGHVVSESFTAGRPVLISNQTPWKDLKAENAGFDLPLINAGVWTRTIDSLSDLNQQEFDVFAQGAATKGNFIANNNQPVDDHRKLFLL
jgi:glycosyltransferase involved in cell wall biosynthesis